MKIIQKGFSAVGILVVFVAVGIIGGVGWYVWQARTDKNNQDTSSSVNSQTPIAEVYKRTTKVPSDWKMYTNEEYKIAMSYPSNWTIRAVNNDGELSGGIYLDKSVNPQGNPQYEFSTRGQSLDEAIAEQKRIVNENKSAEDGIKLTITNEKTYAIDGHKAVRLDITSDDGTAPDSYNTQFYILANNRVYIFDTGFHDDDAMMDDNVLTLFESMKIE